MAVSELSGVRNGHLMLAYLDFADDLSVLSRTLAELHAMTNNMVSIWDSNRTYDKLRKDQGH